MGNLRKESSDRLLAAPREQSTLLPCPACKESGKIIIETETSYSQQICKWCNGLGGLTKRLFKAYHRAERIYNLWKSKGII